MKKFVSVILVFLISISFFSALGCSSSESGNSEGDELREVGDLVVNNNSVYSVVLPSKDNACLNYAAAELTDFIYQSTGANLKVITDVAVDTENGCYISLGKTALLANSGIVFDYSVLNIDGFFIKTVGNNVFIDGAKDKGVLFGVYDFLEKNLGVRFLTQDCTYVPKVDGFKLYEMDDVEIPDFTGRLYLSSATYKNFASPEFVARTRQDYSYLSYVDPKYGEGTSFYLRSGRDHNMNTFVNYDLYAEEHPEFFVEVPDEYASYGDSWRMICLTNGITDDGKLDETMDLSVAKIVIREMKKDILNNPDAYYFGFEQSDGNIYCTCDKCVQAWNDYSATGVLIRFVNVVAREIEKEFKEEGIDRDFRIVTFSYGYTKSAPMKVENGDFVAIDQSVIPDEKIVIRMAYYTNAIYPLFNKTTSEEAARNVGNWHKIAKEFMGWFYDKDYNDYISYLPSLGVIKDNVRAMKENGFNYILIQAAENETYDWQSDLRGYIYRNLLWDQDKDVSELFNEFVNIYWGEVAAPYVKNLIESYERLYAIALANNPGLVIMTSKTEYLDPTKGVLNLDFLNSMIETMKEARKAVENSGIYTKAEQKIYIQRIARVQTTPMFTTVRFFAQYFPLASGKERQDYYTEFFRLADEAGIEMYYEIMSLATYKKQLGVV